MIHPTQIGPANAAFAPSAAEIEWSRRIIAAHAAAAAAGKGVVLVDGKLIESLHVENARRLLGLAEGIEQIASVDTPRARGLSDRRQRRPLRGRRACLGTQCRA